MVRSAFPKHGLTGILLIVIFWYINWFGEGLRTHWAFFPLWLGYILTIDGIAVWRGQRSWITNDYRKFATQFLISIPFWWFFEWLNERAGYWVYLPEGAFSPIAHTFWSTLCFSTVVPAVFVTANMLLSFRWFAQHHVRWRSGYTSRGRWIYFLTGIALLIALLIWPQYGMAFMWVSLFFIISPLNFSLGKMSLMRYTAERDWRMVFVLFAAALICGVFWEMWNIQSWPKWIYTFPYVDGWKIFEMPAAGYLGYLPFGLEIWAIVALLYPAIARDLNDALDARTKPI